MKEATGELSMTVIVIVAVISILAIVSTFLLPQMGNYIRGAWGNITGTSGNNTGTSGNNIPG